MRGVLNIAFAVAAMAAPAPSPGPPRPPVKIQSPPAGSLVQLDGPTGCISTTGGTCAASPLLRGAWDTKVSPDGLNVYVASRYSNAVVVFRRDPATGGLTLLPGTATCVSRDGSGGFCTQGRNLYQPVSLAFSGGGRFLLVVSRLSNGVAVFQRDLLPGPLHGQLTQASGKAGCINTSGAQGCASSQYTALDRARAVVAVGSYVYVAVPNGPFVDVLTQVQSTGELEQLPLPFGCIATGGGAFGVCTKAPPMPKPIALAASDDTLLIGSAYIYNSSSDFPCAPCKNVIGDEDKSTLVELPLKSGAVAGPGVAQPCFADYDNATPCMTDYGLFETYSVTLSPLGDVVAVGTYEVPLFARRANGSLLPDNCLCPGEEEPPVYAVAFSSDEQRLYTPYAVYCRNPTDPLGAGYVLCAATDVGRPRESSGGTNVIPTAMTTSPDGSSVYLTFGTPAGPPTKLGGIYVLHVAH